MINEQWPVAIAHCFWIAVSNRSYNCGSETGDTPYDDETAPAFATGMSLLHSQPEYRSCNRG